MSYRKPNKPRPKPEDMLRKFSVRNGATLRMSFGCYYLEQGHDPHYHDFKNWPAPNYHPGPICQMKSPRDRLSYVDPHTGKPMKTIPIDLVEEGYTSAVIAIDEDDFLQYLEPTAFIDTDVENQINVIVQTNFPKFEDKPKETRFTLFVKNDDGDIIDSVCHGIITILPGSPCPTSGD